jgi:Zn-dependent protease with chaperone function
MDSHTLRPLILVLPLCIVVVAVAAFLHGTWAYIVGGAVIGAFVLLTLPAVLSKPRWRTREADDPGSLVVARF